MVAYPSRPNPEGRSITASQSARLDRLAELVADHRHSPLMQYLETEMLSDQLRKAVDDCELTIHAIAERTGIPQPVLYRWYHGEKQPDGSYRHRSLRLDTADKLAEFFKMRLTKPRQPSAKR